MKKICMQITKKVQRGLIATTLAVPLSLIAVVATVLAWSPDFTSSPYTGNFWKYETGNNLVGVADWIKWNSYGVSAMSFDDYPRLDMTADCAGTPGDRLDYVVAYTNLPNYGIQVWSDCGSPTIREEVEVYINRNYAVVAERAYYYQVHYAKEQHFVSGEVNLTYQRDNGPTHDWLDKETYFRDGSLSCDMSQRYLWLWQAYG